MGAVTGRGKKLIKDVAIYAVGNIGSKLITFLMIPLYTFFVDTSDFGYYDLCLTAIILFMPFLTLQLRDGSFRFLVDCKTEEEKTRVISVSMRLLARSVAVWLLVAVTVSLVSQVAYLWYSFFLLLMLGVLEVFGQMARGLERTKVFVTSNIISAFFIGVFSLLFVIALDMGIRGIFLANIMARLVAILYIEFAAGIVRRYTRWKSDDKAVRKSILRYSLPLLPGVICWWLTGSSDRFFIQHFLGLEDNGIYAVAVRFASILQILATIFYQAWQETALRQYGSADRDRFFSDIFNGYIYVLSALLLLFAFGLRICYPWLIAAEYQESARYLYPLGVSAFLFALSAFLDMGYQCARDTARTLPAIFLAAFVNVGLNFLLVGRLGIYGVLITSIVTYGVLLAYRLHDTKRYFALTFYWRSLVPIAVACVGLCVFYLSDVWWADAAAMAAGLAVLAYFLPDEMKRKALGRIRRKCANA